MINKELLLYIQAQLAAGTPEVIVKEILMARGGWRAGDIDEALRSIQNPIPKVTPPAPTPMQAAPAAVVTPRPQPTPAPVQFNSAPVQSAPAPQPIAPAPTPAPAAPQPAPVSFTAPQQTQPVSPKPAPSMVRMPGTTLVSQADELMAPRPAPAPVVAPKPITPATPASNYSQPMPNPFAPQTPISVTAPAIPLQPEPKIFEMPPMIEPVAPVVVAPSLSTAPLSTINDIPPGPSVLGSAYQPTRADAAPHFVGMQSNPAMTAAQPKTLGRKIAVALGIILFIAVLGGVAAYGYFFYLNPSPKTAFNYILPRLAAAKTGHYKANIVANFDKSLVGSLTAAVAPGSPSGVVISEDTSAQATLVLDGTFDRTDAANSKSEATVTFSTTAAPLSLSFQTKFINSILYVKIPDLGFLTDLLGGNTGVFLPGDWVSFAPADAGSANALSPESQAKILDIFMKGSIITPTVELDKDKAGTVSVHRYQFSINQLALKEALLQSYIVATGAAADEMQTATMDEFLSGFTVADGELWVGVWDRKPYRIIFTIKPVGVTTEQVSDIKFDISLDSFGKPVSIIAPVSAKPFTALFEDARKKGQDAAIKAMLTSVRPTAEIYYSAKKTYLGLCTAPNGLKDLFDAMSSQVLTESPYCKDSAKAYAVAAPLASQSGISCVDVKGSVVSLAALPTGTECN